MAFLNGPRLLDWASSPPHLQFNKYVLTGYRPISSVQDCIRSLFYLHNELGNIYTHGIPLVCFLVLLPLNIPWSQISVTWLGVVHFLACLSPQLGSVLYHLFMNHEGGEPVYHTLLKLDVCGICMINTLGKPQQIPPPFRIRPLPSVIAGALPIVYSTLLCYPFIRTVALLVYILLSSHAIYCAVTARSSVRRLRSFAWQALFRFSFFLLRWVGVGGGSPTSLRHFLTMDALAVLGGVINITRIPERFRPGLFDYWCNSHQIMHACTGGGLHPLPALGRPGRPAVDQQLQLSLRLTPPAAPHLFYKERWEFKGPLVGGRERGGWGGTDAAR
ncbi:hypothetical protein L3Q82_013927 [Scortum barcoo]|uniref:Uncharacterized protein n=1 Tax=Scortum barcoo TaxID=214431 RepID=A0ACB8VUY7_9TELE|nr:hypothetical protein L3Q82_013927 [Scortum barcoo]